MNVDRVFEEVRVALGDLPDTLSEWQRTPEDQQVDTQLWWRELIVGRLSKVATTALSPSQNRAFDQLMVDLDAARPRLRDIGCGDVADEIARLASERVPA